jgi:hypothetical protein
MRFGVSLGLVFLLAAGVARGDFPAGTRAYEAGDYVTALKEWKPLAEAGDVAAMRNLGQMYRLGQGVERDAVEAARWYRKAADIGFDRAQANLAAMYLSGEGVDRDPARAAYWFELAARQGHVIAMYNLGLMYELGMGLRRDPPRALGWLNLAARAGHPQALEKLSELVLAAPVAPPPAETAAAQAPAEPPAQTAKPAEPPPAVAEKTEPPPRRSYRSTASDGTVSYNVFGMIGSLFGNSSDETESKPAPTQPQAKPGPKAEPKPLVALTPPPPIPVPAPPPVAAVPLHAPKVEPVKTEPAKPAVGETIAEGRRELAAGRPGGALSRWLPLADSGNGDAQFLVGRLYAEGSGVERDSVRALMWWTLSSENGNPTAKAAAAALESNLNEEQRADALMLARNFRPKP